MSKNGIWIWVVFILVGALFFIVLEWVIKHPWVFVVFGIVAIVLIVYGIMSARRSNPKPPMDNPNR
jgi:hypothetical protein